MRHQAWNRTQKSFEAEVRKYSLKRTSGSPTRLPFCVAFHKTVHIVRKAAGKTGEMPVFPRVSRFLRIDIDNSAVFRYNKKSAVRAVNGCVPHFLSNSKLNNFTD